MSHWPAFDKSVASSDSILAWFLSFFQKWYTLLIDQKLLYSSCVDLIRIFGSCPKRNQTWWAKRHKSQIWSSLPHQRLSSMPGKILLNDRKMAYPPRSKNRNKRAFTHRNDAVRTTKGTSWEKKRSYVHRNTSTQSAENWRCHRQREKDYWHLIIRKMRCPQ